jgi:hypothetical protein
MKYGTYSKQRQIQLSFYGLSPTYSFKVTDANGCYYIEHTVAPVTNITVVGTN